MIEQEAAVVAVVDGAALVEVPRQSSCSACGQGASCGTATVAKLFGQGNATRLRVLDHLGLAAGERVVIGIRSPVLVRASLVAYLLPLLALLGAAGAAEAAGLGDMAGAASGLGGLLAGLWLAGLVTGGSGARARFRPVLLRRIPTGIPVTIHPPHPTVAG
ncbi:SoxR reducing system RseC family protein [Thiohalocapsa sp. ML1]|uniref:SoxR reducing system RseC family protein n=1 Tax=Thiohalocapsa sp. ML1 TaxID=1431688 RepID=UPI0007323F4D|nr:SoxR reducing system RseC family protein [Thiohalocapsa sp. ML1]